MAHKRSHILLRTAPGLIDEGRDGFLFVIGIQFPGFVAVLNLDEIVASLVGISVFI